MVNLHTGGGSAKTTLMSTRLAHTSCSLPIIQYIQLTYRITPLVYSVKLFTCSLNSRVSVTMK